MGGLGDTGRDMGGFGCRGSILVVEESRRF
jgi:hypothetical protein